MRHPTLSCGVGLAQAHPIAKLPAMRKKPSAMLGPVTVKPIPYQVVATVSESAGAGQNIVLNCLESVFL